MAITREKKESLVSEVTDVIKGSTSIVFVSFKGLSAPEDCKLRNAIINADMNYTVIKKNLLYRSFDNSKIEGEKLSFDNEVAIVYGKSDDSTFVARKIKEIIEKENLPLNIIGGVYEKTFTDKEKMEDISNIPSLEMLYAKLAYIFNSPLTRFAIVMKEYTKIKNN